MRGSMMERVVVSALALFMVLDGFLLAQDRAEIGEVTGQAQVIRLLKRIPAEKGMELQQRDIVVTEAGSNVKVHLPGGSVVEVAASSRIKMTKYLSQPGEGDSKTVELLSGTGSFDVVKQKEEDIFEVKSPVAVVGVRGTRFIVNHSQSRRHGVQSQVVVLKGNVAVVAIRFSGGPGMRPIIVRMMESSTVNSEAPPTPPKPMSIRQLQNFVEESGLALTVIEEAGLPPEILNPVVDVPLPEVPIRQLIQERRKELQQDVFKDRVRQIDDKLVNEIIFTKNRLISRPIAPPTQTD